MKNFKEASSLYDLTTLSSAILSEDEQTLFYVKTTIDSVKDGYQAAIYAKNLQNASEISIVEDGFINNCPTVNGTKLLYLSNKTGTTQVHFYDLVSKENRQLTFSLSPVMHVQWIQNSQSFLFTTQLDKSTESFFTWDKSFTGITTNTAPFYRISNLKYQADGVGFIDPEKTTYLCEQTIDNFDVTVISPQATGYGLRRVADCNTEGTTIYFERNLIEGDDYNHDSGIFAYDRNSKQIQHLTQSFDTGIFGEGTVSPDGNYLVMVGNSLPYETPNQFGLFLYDFKTTSLKKITEGIDIQFADNSVSDYYQNVRNPIIHWHPDSKRFYVQTSEYGRVKIYEVLLNGEMVNIAPEQAVVKEVVISKAGVLYALISKPDRPLLLAVYEDGEWKEISNSVEESYQDYSFASYQEIEYTAADGGVIHGLMVLPADFQADKKYPLILNIHGGPYMMHAMNFYHETQYLAANGYLVLLVNPRGSYGYGQEHTYGVYEKYGKGDYTDLMTAIDGVINDHSFVDASQLFVTGGSYGGFMTNWIITQTNRFKAAVSQRSMSNFVSMFGTSDIGYYFYKDETGHDISRPDKLWESSPLAYVEQVETPLLLIHAKDDLRCQFEQAQQFYTGLRYFNKTAEMLVFPNSGHELSRTGRPSYRVERLKAILDWFERYRSK